MKRGKDITHCWYFSELDCQAHLPDPALQRMILRARAALPNETGGTLIGSYERERHVAKIAAALGVEKGARCGKTWFIRPSDNVDTQLQRIYKESRGKIHYLGEWHTHPNSSPDPSPGDLCTLQSLAESPVVASDTPLLIILGGNYAKQPPALLCILATRSGSFFEGKYRGLEVNVKGASFP